MKYGCIGEHLKHSFSKEIHNALSDYEYEIHEVAREDLEGFAERADFRAINVTIPYKELIMPYLWSIDDAASDIGAVNTVVNRDGKLYGYNTDFYGMTRLIEHAGISVRGKKIAILGSGGTSKTASAVVRALGATCVLQVSRTARDGVVTYEELYAEHSDAEIIINTTPCGMFPNILDKPLELSKFPALSGVIDAVYNPLRTPLIREAMRLGVPAEGGLYMLVAQAVRASEIFIDTTYPDGECERVYRKILADKENVVLVGMPASGKTTVGRIIAEALGRRLIDTDELIVRNAGMPIPEIFDKCGEAAFRDMESDAVTEAAAMSGVVIATGGGAVLRDKNVEALKENGRLFFLDRSADQLIPTSDRPLSSTVDAIRKRYEERYPIYSAVCDVRVDGNASAEAVAEQIIAYIG